MGVICFGNRFCMDKTLLFLIIFIAIGVLIYDRFTLKKEITKINGNKNQINQINQLNQKSVQKSTSQQLSPPIQPIQPIQPVHLPLQLPPTIGQVMKEYDYRTLEDPLTPPFKRDDYMVPIQMVRPDLYGMFTSGAPGTFRKMGYLKSTNPNGDYKYLNLIGRPKYNGSSIYEYYVTSTNRDDSIKFYLHKYKKELYDGDNVKVPQIGSEEFEVIIDKDLNLEYNPLLF
jgi:hypothetical protein